jgi:predicted transcriptional regulator
MDTVPTDVKFTIRLPAQVAEAMRALAHAHDRSLNGEIVRALRAYAAAQRKRRERTGEQA